VASSIAQISCTDIGGVPVLHAPQPPGTPFLAQLVSVTGRARCSTRWVIPRSGSVSSEMPTRKTPMRFGRHSRRFCSVFRRAAPSPGGRFSRYPLDSTRRVDGRRFRRRDLPAVTRKDNERELIVDEAGVTLIGEDYLKTVLFDEVAGAVYFQDRVIHLYGLDGHFIVVAPRIWRRAGGLFDLLVEAIPKGVGGRPSRWDVEVHRRRSRRWGLGNREQDWSRAIPC